MAVIYTLILGSAICVFFLYCFALPSLYLRFPVPVEKIRSNAQELYWRGIRDIIQFNPRCARYDPDLGYLLRPGSCRFKNLEFDTTVHVNSKGLRDDENSLVRPEVVAIGDSYTMGWGVEAEESFPKIIQRRLNKKTLNAGISSYGTARELSLLDRIDLNNAKYIIIQYAQNDFGENRDFVEKGFLTPSSENTYLSRIKDFQKGRGKLWTPGAYMIDKFSRNLFSDTESRDQNKSGTAGTKTCSNDADCFSAVLESWKKILNGRRVIVFSIDQYKHNNDRFIAALQTLPSPILEKFFYIDVSQFLTSDDYFVLDDHMNARGHRKVAHAIAAKIIELEGL